MPPLIIKVSKLPLASNRISSAPSSAFSPCLHLSWKKLSSASSPYSTRIRFPNNQLSYAPLKQSQKPFSNLSCASKRDSSHSPRLQRTLPLNLQLPSRNFTTTVRRSYKSVQEARSRYRVGPFTIISVFVFLSAGFGMVFYFRYEKARMERKRIADASKGVGRPKVGGKFELLDQEGNAFNSEERMKGRFSLVYFGFSHCPDICPEELDKMSSMIDLVSTTFPSSSSTSPFSLLPLFITCDPARDTPSVLKSYLQEFHPAMVGLTGAWDQIKAVCKLYRVYFSTPEGVRPGMDYLVDHSIYFYLMDPDGDFVEAIGRQHSAEQAATIITAHMSDWKREGRTSL